MNPQTETFIIDGMHCAHCVKAVEQALEALEGVTVHSVDVGAAQVHYDADETPRAAIERAVEEAGYTVKTPA